MGDILMTKELNARDLRANDGTVVAMSYTAGHGVIYHCGEELREMLLREVAELRSRDKGKNSENMHDV
jgi:hypothetical protein